MLDAAYGLTKTAMITRRQRRVADLIHEEISILLERKAADPRLAGVTITDVEVSADLQLATIYYSVLGEDEEALKMAQAGLEHAASFFRKALAESLSLRLVPHLRFRFDRSLAQGQRIEQLLSSLREDE